MELNLDYATDYKILMSSMFIFTLRGASELHEACLIPDLVTYVWFEEQFISYTENGVAEGTMIKVPSLIKREQRDKTLNHTHIR